MDEAASSVAACVDSSNGHWLFGSGFSVARAYHDSAPSCDFADYSASILPAFIAAVDRGPLG
jgi:hypothetical protein